MKKAIYIFVIISLLFSKNVCYGGDVSIDKIIEIESSGNPLSYNSQSNARGLMQITPIVLLEYNQDNNIQYNNIQYNSEDLFNPKINIKIGTWYLQKIKNRYLKKRGEINDILICYNWGYGNWKKWKQGEKLLPEETKNYLKKYKEE